MMNLKLFVMAKFRYACWSSREVSKSLPTSSTSGRGTMTGKISLIGDVSIPIVGQATSWGIICRRWLYGYFWSFNLAHGYSWTFGEDHGYFWSFPYNKKVVFYGLPGYADFYAEIVRWMDLEGEGAEVKVVVGGWDWWWVERVVETDKVERFVPLNVPGMCLSFIKLDWFLYFDMVFTQMPSSQWIRVNGVNGVAHRHFM